MTLSLNALHTAELASLAAAVGVVFSMPTTAAEAKILQAAAAKAVSKNGGRPAQKLEAALESLQRALAFSVASQKKDPRRGTVVLVPANMQQAQANLDVAANILMND